jgi:hypothetical protein
VKDEARAVGKYQHPLLTREDDRIQIVTVGEILAGKRLDLPLAIEVVNSAKSIGGEQLGLL